MEKQLFLRNQNSLRSSIKWMELNFLLFNLIFNFYFQLTIASWSQFASNIWLIFIILSSICTALLFSIWFILRSTLTLLSLLHHLNASKINEIYSCFFFIHQIEMVSFNAGIFIVTMVVCYCYTLVGCNPLMVSSSSPKNGILGKFHNSQVLSNQLCKF